MRTANLARFIFLDPGAPEFFAGWDHAATDVVADLRASAGRNPHDDRLASLIGELAARSDVFRVRWAAHDLKSAPSGVKTLNHPLVGEIELNYEQFGCNVEPRISPDDAISAPRHVGRRPDARRLWHEVTHSDTIRAWLTITPCG